MTYLDQLHGVQPTTQGGGTLAIDGSGFMTANVHQYPGWTVDLTGTHNQILVDFGPGLINCAGYSAQFYLSNGGDYAGPSGIKAYGSDATSTIIFRRDNSTIGTIGANACRYLRLTFGAAGATGGTVEYGLDNATWTTLGTFPVDAAIVDRTNAAFGIDIYPGQAWAFLNTAPAALTAPGLSLGTPTATSLPYTLTASTGGTGAITYALRATTGGTTTTTAVAAGSGTLTVLPGHAYSVVAVATDSASTPVTASSGAQTATTPNPITSAAITPASSSLAGLAVEQDVITLTYADGTTRQAVSADGICTSDLGTYSSSTFGRFTAPAQTNALQTCHRQFAVPANSGAGQPSVVANATTTVAAGATYTGVTINPAGPVSVAIGVTATAPTVTVQGTNNPSQAVTWSSSNPSTVSVNATTGAYTGVAAGGAVLTALAADGVTHSTLGVVSEQPGATLDALSFVTSLAPVLVPAVALAVVAQLERTGGLLAGVALDQTAIRTAYAALVAASIDRATLRSDVTSGATGVSVELANDAVSATANAARDAVTASSVGTKIAALVVDGTGRVTTSNTATVDPAAVAVAVVAKQHDTEAFHALGSDGQPIAPAQTLRLQRTMPDGTMGHQFIYADANGATLGQSAVIAGA